MFFGMLIDKWGRNTQDSLECQFGNDCVMDGQYIDDLLARMDHSSLEMFQIVGVPAIHKNITEYFENNTSKPHVEIKRDINQIMRDTLLALPEAVTYQILDLIHIREPNDH